MHTLHMHASAWKFVALNCYKKKRSVLVARGGRASHARTRLDSIVDDHATTARTAPSRSGMADLGFRLFLLRTHFVGKGRLYI